MKKILITFILTSLGFIALGFYGIKMATQSARADQIVNFKYAIQLTGIENLTQEYAEFIYYSTAITYCEFSANKDNWYSQLPEQYIVSLAISDAENILSSSIKNVVRHEKYQHFYCNSVQEIMARS